MRIVPLSPPVFTGEIADDWSDAATKANAATIAARMTIRVDFIVKYLAAIAASRPAFPRAHSRCSPQQDVRDYSNHR
jgi:hypothetical protein